MGIFLFLPIASETIETDREISDLLILPFCIFTRQRPSIHKPGIIQNFEINFTPVNLRYIGDWTFRPTEGQHLNEYIFQKLYAVFEFLI